MPDVWVPKKIVQLNSKDIKYPKFKFMGRRFMVDGKMETVRRCKICGVEFFYRGTHEPAHCGRDGCTEFWRRFMQKQFMQADMVRDKEYFGRKAVVTQILNNARSMREAEDGMRRTQIIPEQMIHRKVDRRRMTFATFSLKGRGYNKI
jgi:hypothetical protein